ncbi:leucine-rich repeat domain-containing protein, partial [Clostridium perfringens]|uniref:leucine-rich repeat domain-containing protein n=1 Tax=Clostridium perfringens TaxID=1502 RepID=UPI0024BC02A3
MKKLKLQAILLSSALLVNTSAVSLTTFAKELNEKSNYNAKIEFNDSINVSQKLKLSTYEDFSNMTNIGLNRGNYHGREPLGFILPANVEFKIRQVNTNLKKDLTLDLFNDDRNTEKSITIPKNGDWITVQSDSLSVPFIRKISGEEIPEIEFILKGKVDKLPIYKYGMDESLFFKEWDDLDSNFAFIENNKVQMLIPKIDKNTLKNMKDFASIDELFEFYNEMFNTYDRLLGLEKNSDNPLHNNVDTQYFVKADKHGAGAAYYSSNYTAQNSESMSAYLEKGWLPLHEVGHGYEYDIKSKGIHLVDVFNNILAHTYESTYLKNDEGWLYNGDRLGRDLSMKNVRENGSYDSANYQDKLGMFVYLLDFIGEEKFAEFNRLYREKNNSGELKSKSAITIFNDLLAEVTGYNFKDYFNSYNLIDSTNVLNNEKYSKYKNVFILGDIVTDETIAKKIKDEYGLKSIYSLISTEDMLKSNVNIENGIINITLPKNAVNSNKIIQLKDGDNILKEVSIKNNEAIQLTNVKPGRYTLTLVNNETTFDNYTEVKTIDVKSGNNTINIESLDNLSPIQNILDQKIVFKGLGDNVFAELDINLSDNTVKLKTNSGKPHSYYSSEYARIEILNENNSVIFSKSYIGDKNENYSEEVINIKPGYKIKIYHDESPSRLNILDSNYDKLNYSLQKNNTFVITETGLDNGKLNLNENFERLVEMYAQNLKNSLGDKLFDYDFYTNHRVLLKNLINKLPSEKKEEFINKYGDIIYNKNNIVYIPDINLKKELNKNLKQDLSSDITKEQLNSLTGELNLNNKNISDLTGIENCTKITNLQLQNNKLTNLLPLQNMTNLNELNLNENHIKDISYLSSLNNLQKLSLDTNSINDISPLKTLTNLSNIHLNNQSIQGGIEKSQGNTVKIQNLIKDVNGEYIIPYKSDQYTYDSEENKIIFNNINETGQKSYSFNQSISIGNATSDFSGTVTQNVVYDEIANIPDENLKAALNEKLGNDRHANQDIYVSELNSLNGELNLMNKNITDLTGLENCIGINRLRLARNQITNITPLANLTNLTFLSLDNNQISDISALSNLNNLTELYLGWRDDSNSNKSNNITDISPLANLTNLMYLDITNNNVSTLNPLANLTKLEELSAQNNEINDISSLTNLTNLKKLRLAYNKIVDISPLKALDNTITYYTLNQQNPTLDTLNFSGTSLTITNPLKDLDGNPVEPTNISNSGVYSPDNNTITFENLPEGNTNISFNFSKQTSLGSDTANFSGTVTQPINKETTNVNAYNVYFNDKDSSLYINASFEGIDNPTTEEFTKVAKLVDSQGQEVEGAVITTQNFKNDPTHRKFQLRLT